MRLLFFVMLCLSMSQANAARIWIDTDAACGLGEFYDPDDCLAVLFLLRSGLRVEGISSVFGNASEASARAVTKELVSRAGINLRVQEGAASAGWFAPPESPASRAIAEAAKRGPLTIAALGPLTNVAAGLAVVPMEQRRKIKIVAVMGKQRGEIFHPAEGSQDAFLWHGPIFSDLNYASDPSAARDVLKSGAEIVLAPYALARSQPVTQKDLDAIAQGDAAAIWVAAHARPWLNTWRTLMGRDEFFPFDLAAAGIVRRQEICTREPVTAGYDTSIGWLGGPDSMMFGAYPSLGLVATVKVCRRSFVRSVDTMIEFLKAKSSR